MFTSFLSRTVILLFSLQTKRLWIYSISTKTVIINKQRLCKFFLFNPFNLFEFILDWSKWMSFMVIIFFKRFWSFCWYEYFISIIQFKLSSTPINKNTFRWFMFTFKIIWSEFYSTWLYKYIQFEHHCMAFNSTNIWMLSLSMSSSCGE